MEMILALALRTITAITLYNKIANLRISLLCNHFNRMLEISIIIH